jgi:hypothetical protein
MSEVPKTPKTIEFKVDILWKTVILTGVGLAGKLSWQAWNDQRDTLETVRRMLAVMETRLSVAEVRIESNTQNNSRQDSELDEMRKRK